MSFFEKQMSDKKNMWEAHILCLPKFCLTLKCFHFNAVTQNFLYINLFS